MNEKVTEQSQADTVFDTSERNTSSGSSEAASQRFLNELRNDNTSTGSRDDFSSLARNPHPDGPAEPRAVWRPHDCNPHDVEIKKSPEAREIVGGLPRGLTSGKYETTTGDKIEYRDGKQILSMAGGNKIELDANGKITGDGIFSIKASRDGKERSITMDDGSTILLDQAGIARIEHEMPTDKKGNYTLTTGDYLENDGNKQTLITQEGNEVIVNKDGSFEVNGKVASVNADGSKLELKDGTTVTIKNGTISSVERNGQSARLTGEIPIDQWGGLWNPPSTKGTIRFLEIPLRGTNTPKAPGR